jgi:hypothetical protein
MRDQAQEFLDGKKGGGKARTGAARVLGIGAYAPSGDDTGSVLADPDFSRSGEDESGCGDRLVTAPDTEMPGPVPPGGSFPARRTRRVANH